MDPDHPDARRARERVGQVAPQGKRALEIALQEALCGQWRAERRVAALTRDVEAGLQRRRGALRAEVLAEVRAEYQEAGMDNPGGVFSAIAAAREQLRHEAYTVEGHRLRLIEEKRKFRKRQLEEGSAIRPK